MFRDAKAFSGFAVNDIDRARAFYGETLGVQVDDIGGGLLQLTLGTGATVLVYPKPDHTPATFTILNFTADDVDAAVDALTAKGVPFEHYPEHRHGCEGHHARRRAPTIAWFRDPAGNILSVGDFDA